MLTSHSEIHNRRVRLASVSLPLHCSHQLSTARSRTQPHYPRERRPRQPEPWTGAIIGLVDLQRNRSVARSFRASLRRACTVSFFPVSSRILVGRCHVRSPEEPARHGFPVEEVSSPWTRQLVHLSRKAPSRRIRRMRRQYPKRS